MFSNIYQNINEMRSGFPPTSGQIPTTLDPLIGQIETLIIILYIIIRTHAI